MNIRYRFNDKPIFVKTFSIEQIERGEVSELISMYGKPLSRDIGAGLKDKTGKEIFERDKARVEGLVDYTFEGAVKFDSYMWFLISPDGTEFPFYDVLLEDLELEIIGREE